MFCRSTTSPSILCSLASPLSLPAVTPGAPLVRGKTKEGRALKPSPLSGVLIYSGTGLPIVHELAVFNPLTD